MKKLFAALLSLCLMLSAFAAFAEEPQTQVINWSDYEAKAAEMEGQFAEIANTGLKMFVPAQFKDNEIAQEDLDKGILMVLKPEGENAVVNAQVLPMDIDSFKANLTKQGVTVWDLSVNEVAYIYYSAESNGVVGYGVALPTTDGMTLTFGFTAENMEAYREVFRTMLASLQPVK